VKKVTSVNKAKVPVNKTDMVEKIAEQAKISKAAATSALNAMLNMIVSTLKSGNSVSLLNFGVFSVKFRAARVGRNPKTGQPIEIEAANAPVFKAGKALKDAVNSTADVLEEEVE